MTFRLTPDDHDRWATEADPKYRHPLVAALVLEVESAEGSREKARELVYEALILVRKRLGFPGPLQILSDALALFCREDVQKACKEGAEHSPERGLWLLQCASGKRMEVTPWPFPRGVSKLHTMPAAAALVMEARRRRGESLSRKLAEEIEQAFLLTQPPPDRPGPQSAAAARRNRR